MKLVSTGRATGRIKRGTKLSDSTGSEASVTGGRLTVKPNCKVVGSISVADQKWTVERADLTKDKNMMCGVGHDPSGTAWFFEAVRK